MRKGEHADLRVGKHKAAHQIVSQVTLDGVAKRFLNQTAPRFPRDCVKLESARHVVLRGKRLEHRVPDPLGKEPRQRVKTFQLFVLLVVSGQFEHRASAHLVIDIAQEQRAMLSVICVWRA